MDPNFCRGSWSLFSASSYCGEFGNAGAMMSEDKTLICTFQILKPTKKKKAKCQETHNTWNEYNGKGSKEINVILTLPHWDL